MSKFIITKNYLNQNYEYLCILTDFTFWIDAQSELLAWCHANGCLLRGMTVNIPDEGTNVLFTLRWA